MNNRLTKLFDQKKIGVLNIYCTAGYPQLNSTLEVLTALQNSGADIVEIVAAKLAATTRALDRKFRLSILESSLSFITGVWPMNGPSHHQHQLASLTIDGQSRAIDQTTAALAPVPSPVASSRLRRPQHVAELYSEEPRAVKGFLRFLPYRSHATCRRAIRVASALGRS